MSIFETPSTCIAAQPDDFAKAVLLPGDPLRAKAIAETYLEDVLQVNKLRNMLGYTGWYRGRRISVMGGGIGMHSTMLYAHELYTYYGVESIVRLGSAQGVQEAARRTSMVAALSASTDSRFASHYEFPGILTPQADYDLVKTALSAAEELGVSIRPGQVFTTELLYNTREDALRQYRKFGILAVDMETAGLYWQAMENGKRALSLLRIQDELENSEPVSVVDRLAGFKETISVALETAWEFA